MSALDGKAAINPVTPIADFTEASFDRVLAVNLRGPFFAIQRAGVALRDAEHRAAGSRWSRSWPGRTRSGSPGRTCVPPAAS